MVTVSQLVFACHEKACAPPPAGKGGSLPGGGRSGRPGRQGNSDYEQAAIDRHTIAKAAWKKAKLSQDGTTNVNRPGGIGGGSAGSRGGSKPVKHSPTATHAAFRDADAITPRRGGGSVTTKHRGSTWAITVRDGFNKVIHSAQGRSKDSEAALNRIVREYKKYQ